jgi:Mn-dependent DtxR family transcriptional regulator
MSKDKEFEKHEKLILNTLYQAKRPLSTNQISERIGVSWQTTNKYLSSLHQSGYLRKKREGRGTKWRLQTK